MMRIHSFAPISGEDARILILGSMPGKASLQAGQYYAHPRNAFWAIIEAVYGIDRNLAYAERCARLVAQRVAVWDVLKTCTRSSSLDSDIDATSIVINDFPAFLVRHPGIGRIYFNGAMAEKTFLRHVQPILTQPFTGLAKQRLPSTSPANASYSFERKLSSWKELRAGLD